MAKTKRHNGFVIGILLSLAFLGVTWIFNKALDTVSVLLGFDPMQITAAFRKEHPVAIHYVSELFSPLRILFHSPARTSLFGLAVLLSFLFVAGAVYLACRCYVWFKRGELEPDGGIIGVIQRDPTVIQSNCVTVGNARNGRDWEHLHTVFQWEDKVFPQDVHIDEEHLFAWADRFPMGAYFLKRGNILLGAMSMWPLREDAWRRLLAGDHEHELAITADSLVSLNDLKKRIRNGLPTYWYVGDIITEWRVQEAEAFAYAKKHRLPLVVLMKLFFFFRNQVLHKRGNRALLQLLLGRGVDLWKNTLIEMAQQTGAKLHDVNIAAFAESEKGRALCETFEFAKHGRVGHLYFLQCRTAHELEQRVGHRASLLVKAAESV